MKTLLQQICMQIVILNMACLRESAKLSKF